jgi:hypothetical protein
VESSCELGNEPSGSIKCWELPTGCKSCGLSSGTQLHRVSYGLHTRRNKLNRRIPSSGMLHRVALAKPQDSERLNHQGDNNR